MRHVNRKQFCITVEHSWSQNIDFRFETQRLKKKKKHLVLLCCELQQ